MLDVVFIGLWLFNRSKAKKARLYGSTVDAEKYAKRAKIFGWIEVVWLIISVLIGIAIVTSSSTAGY